MAWRRLGDNPLSEPMMVSLLWHMCDIRPRWIFYSIDDHLCLIVSWGSYYASALWSQYWFSFYLLVKELIIRLSKKHWQEWRTGLHTSSNAHTLPGVDTICISGIASVYLDVALNLRAAKWEYSRKTRSVVWLLMPWLHASPDHQLPWYWIYIMNNSSLEIVIRPRVFID